VQLLLEENEDINDVDKVDETLRKKLEQTDRILVKAVEIIEKQRYRSDGLVNIIRDHLQCNFEVI
jgi:hypothetical protein